MTKELKPVTESLVIHHPAFTNAFERVEQCYRFAALKSEAEGMAVVGESGTGKTSVLRALLDKHARTRDKDGLTIPVLFVTVPSSPTVKSLAGAILEAIGVPDAERGSENDKTRRIRRLFKETGVRILLIDEFQHFIDRGKQKIMYGVADWLKILIDETRTTLIVAGLPSCLTVIDQNEQLARRFSSPQSFSRFNWQNDHDRDVFICLLQAFQTAMQQRYDLPDLGSEEMAFKFWVATGGLIGYVAKLLRHTERNAIVKQRSILTLDDLHDAHLQSVWALQQQSDLPQPFNKHRSFGTDQDLFLRVAKIGSRIDPIPQSNRGRPSGRRETVSSLLAVR